MNWTTRRTLSSGSAALVFALIGATASAQDGPEFGPDTCVSGFVWREAFKGDHVCVDPEIRAQAQNDNLFSWQRRDPRGGPYGPDTCLPGFVWREARSDDHVCVTPETRTQTASDNRAAPSRVVRMVSPIGRAALLTHRRSGVLAPPPAVSGTPPPRPAQGAASQRGFDDKGEPYIQDTLSDGSIRRQTRHGVTVTKPDGTSQYFPNQFLAANAPTPTPPDLPDDPALGRAWVTYHDQALLDLISLLVNGDQSEMQRFKAAESTAVGSDLFGQVDYRTKVLGFLAQP